MKKTDLLQGGEEPKKEPVDVLLARRACLLEGCSAETSSCFGGNGVGLCVEAKIQYNELTHKEMVKEAKTKATTLEMFEDTPLAEWFRENKIVGVI